ncbi:PREDICTED: olfactory receptor 10AG1-like [Nanorana parkeri]|uniref:olfactory receptor 10AG1-like n=1 Tax=Nanorana parkeri TaxID=125878 RepID=UPI000853F562|nr:PREDICTED: olfactory receptor 10AG1-like [Nanorana parkeri]
MCGGSSRERRPTLNPFRDGMPLNALDMLLQQSRKGKSIALSQSRKAMYAVYNSEDADSREQKHYLIITLFNLHCPVSFSASFSSGTITVLSPCPLHGYLHQLSGWYGGTHTCVFPAIPAVAMCIHSSAEERGTEDCFKPAAVTSAGHSGVPKPYHLRQVADWEGERLCNLAQPASICPAPGNQCWQEYLRQKLDDNEHLILANTCGQNKTAVMEVFLLGFGDLRTMRPFIFLLFLILYLTTVTGNMVIIVLIAASPRLHSPMYFFICNLSACEMFFTTVIMPNLLYILWWNGGHMTFYGCITQLYVGSATGSAECLLLTVMAYDRHLAICNPLRYSSIMNINTRNHLVVWAWMTGYIILVTSTIIICNLQFCGLNIIDHLFCDLAPILQLSSSDTSVVEMEVFLILIILSVFPFVLIILSYGSIFYTILRISSKTGRQKTFSTCSSHLASVCMYFGTIFIIYLVPSQQNFIKINKMLSLLYTVVTPLLNPVIYSLRNKEMVECFKYSLALINIH